MAAAMFIAWTFCAMLISNNLVQGIGVNWGSQSSHPLNPSIVVGMLKDNGIKQAKLFDADGWTVSAFAGSGIEVMVGIPNNQLKGLANDYDKAKDWVKENVTKQINDVDIRLEYYILLSKNVTFFTLLKISIWFLFVLTQLMHDVTMCFILAVNNNYHEIYG